MERELTPHPPAPKGIDDALAAGVTVRVHQGDDATRAVERIATAAGLPPALPVLLDAIKSEPDRDRQAARVTAELVPRLADLSPVEFAAHLDRVRNALPWLPVSDMKRAVADARKATVRTQGAPNQTTEIEVEDPWTIDAPLALRDGTVYAVALRTVQRPRADGHGNELVRCLSVLTWDGDTACVDDGKGDVPIPDLPDGIMVDLEPGTLPPAAPRLDTLRRFANGQRMPGPAVFGRVSRILDHFLDLSTAPGGQDAAVLVLTAWAMGTWWTRPGRITAAYLKLEGPKGSGKTVALEVLSGLVFCGETVLSSTTPAALRDLCAAGATLLVDEAETLGPNAKSDTSQDRRALLLGGTRPGSTVALQKPSPDGGWHTERVPVHGARAFAGINGLDDVLGSRTIRMPIVRTADRERAKREINHVPDWPDGEDPQAVRDALTLWAIATLPAAKSTWYDAARNACPFAGRAAEPWLPALAVALSVDAEDGGDRAARLVRTARAFNEDAPPDRDRDLAVLTAIRDLVLSGDIPETDGVLLVRPRSVASALDDDARRDGEDDAAWTTRKAQRVGRAVKALRLHFKTTTEHDNRKVYNVHAATLAERLRAYGLDDDPRAPQDPNLPNLPEPTAATVSDPDTTSPGSMAWGGSESGANPHGIRTGEVGEVQSRGTGPIVDTSTATEPAGADALARYIARKGTT